MCLDAAISVTAAILDLPASKRTTRTAFGTTARPETCSRGLIAETEIARTRAINLLVHEDTSLPHE